MVIEVGLKQQKVWAHQRIVVEPEVDQILAGVQQALRQGCQLVEAQRSERRKREGSIKSRTKTALPNYFEAPRSDKWLVN